MVFSNLLEAAAPCWSRRLGDSGFGLHHFLNCRSRQLESNALHGHLSDCRSSLPGSSATDPFNCESITPPPCAGTSESPDRHRTQSLILSQKVFRNTSVAPELNTLI